MKPRPSDPSQLSINYFFPSGQTNLVWSDEAARRTPRLNRDNLLELARAAEQVGFDSLFIADNWSGHQREAEAPPATSRRLFTRPCWPWAFSR